MPNLNNKPEGIPFGLRDRYIIAQALVLGIEKLGEVENPHREISNMQDMATLATDPAFAPFTAAILMNLNPGYPSQYPTAANFIEHGGLWAEDDFPQDDEPRKYPPTLTPKDDEPEPTPTRVSAYSGFCTQCESNPEYYKRLDVHERFKHHPPYTGNLGAVAEDRKFNWSRLFRNFKPGAENNG